MLGPGTVAPHKPEPTDCGNATAVRRPDRGRVTPEWHADRRSRPALGPGVPTVAAES